MGDTTLEAYRSIAGRYELETPIGRGGMGEVWRAKHVALNTHVAIKFLHGASAQDESARRRFTTEAQVTAQLKTRHAVQVFDFGVTDDGHPFLVMELLDGETLGHRLEAAGRLGVVETVRILGQAARALQRAHQLGIVHRDFKPDNIVLTIDEDGTDYVKVLDFGLAKLARVLDAPDENEPAVARDDSDPPSGFTKTGAVMGTPYYMAPEQVRDASVVDLRADIWAFGVVAFECLTGAPPFTGKNLVELFDRVQRGAHPRAHEVDPSVPAAFDEWFDKACAPNPASRFPDANVAMKKLVDALECGKIDIEPSGGIGRGLGRVRERRVVVESGDDNAQPNAQTMAHPGGRVQPRSRSDAESDAQFRKLTLTAAAKPVSHADTLPGGMAAGALARNVIARNSDTGLSHSINEEQQRAAAVAVSHAPTLLDEGGASRDAPPRRKRSPLVVVAGAVMAVATVGALYLRSSPGRGPGGDAASRSDAEGSHVAPPAPPELPVASPSAASVAPPPLLPLAAAIDASPMTRSAPVLATTSVPARVKTPRSPAPPSAPSIGAPPGPVAPLPPTAAPHPAAPLTPDPASYR